MSKLRCLVFTAVLVLAFSSASRAVAKVSFGTLDSGIVLFTASDAVAGLEVWRSDGTVRGTFRLTTHACTESCETANLLLAPWVLAGDRAFFVVMNERGKSELWVTDGTRRGTSRILAGAPPGILTRTLFMEPVWVESLGLLFFQAASDDGDDGYDLWRSDGTPEGTFQVKEFGESPNIRELTGARNRVFFHARHSQSLSLWTSDGTEAGTTLVKAPAPDITTYGGPSWLRAVGPRLLFFFPTSGLGTELWESDGTPAGTRLLADLDPGPASPIITDARVIGRRLFLSAQTSRRGFQLWVSNGTPAGTRVLLGRFGEPLHLPPLPLFKGRYYFEALHPSGGTSIWSTDGTRAGTRMLVDACRGECSNIGPAGMTFVGNRLLFAAGDSSHGRELWLSDGTAQGTRRVRDLCPGPCSSSPRVYEVAGRIVFSAVRSPTAARQLWRTDGTSEGTVRLTDFTANGVADELVGQLPGALLFPVVSPSGQHQLWVSDGTRPGTHLLKTIRVGE